MRQFGILIASLALAPLVGCYSFAGGGLPPHIHSVAIVTFDNQTASPDLPKELYDEMHRELERKLGVRDAPQDRADALVHGVISAYESDVPVSFSANTQSVTARRRLQVTIEIEIVDQSNGHVLFQNKAMREEADYAERAEPEGRRQAIAKIVQKVVEGVQSNW
jgi:hypothetical protein